MWTVVFTRAAGPELLAECETLRGCETGGAKITKGYKLPCKYVIHAVGPRWYDGRHSEREQLISCYRTSLMLAKKYGCESVAFPLISSGIFGYPKDQALKVAIGAISSFLLENEMTVYIVIFDRKAYQISGKLFADIASYIWPTEKNPGAGSLSDWAVHGWVPRRSLCRAKAGRKRHRVWRRHDWDRCRHQTEILRL